MQESLTECFGRHTPMPPSI